MRRRSVCWDTVASEIVELDSSDDDVPKRFVRGKNKYKIGHRLNLSDSSSVEEITSDSDSNVAKTPAFNEVKVRTPYKNSKFRIISDESSDSDDCVIYSDDDQTPIKNKVKQLTLPTFSYETPDKKTISSNRKLLSDISNKCGTPFKSLSRSILSKSILSNSTDEPRKKTKSGRNSKEGKNTAEGQRAQSDRLFDSLLGLQTPATNNPSFLGEIDSLPTRGVQQETSKIPKASQKSKTEDDPRDRRFKKPATFTKQKEVGSKVRRPGDSKIISRRTDDSDSASTDGHISSSVENPKDNVEAPWTLPTPTKPRKRSPPPSPWGRETIEIPSNPEELYVKASPRPPLRKRGKTSTNYRFDDLKSALEEIAAHERKGSSANSQGFLSSLSETVQEDVSHPMALFYREKFGKKKEELASVLFRLFNKDVFESKLPEDMKLEWSGRMTSSAGITHLSRKMVSGEWNFLARITLSKPIVTTAARLRDTLIHEMCHAAVWILDHQKDGHGSFWKKWTYKARETFPDLMAINTCHSYSRNWKFYWECVSCGYTIGRMTKSFDTQRFSCGRCHSKFVLKEKDNKKKREANGFAKFVKENYSSVKSQGTAHKDVMKILSQKYQNEKGNKPLKTSDVEDVNDDEDDGVIILGNQEV